MIPEKDIDRRLQAIQKKLIDFDVNTSYTHICNLCNIMQFNKLKKFDKTAHLYNSLIALESHPIV